MKCKNCGREIANNAKFCSFCGEKVDQSQNTSNESVARGAQPLDNEDKYSIKEMIDKIAKFITSALSLISVVMVIGGLVGIFDSNPVPFLILVGVVMFANWLEEKLPKFPTIFFAVFEVVALIICFNISNNAVAVFSVKEGCPNQYPNITYERAFEDYFANAKWEAYGKDEDGNEVVKFTGTCTYLGSDVVAEVKFTIYEEQESFIVSSVKINGEDMGFWGDTLVIDVFEEYENSH